MHIPQTHYKRWVNRHHTRSYALTVTNLKCMFSHKNWINWSILLWPAHVAFSGPVDATKLHQCEVLAAGRKWNSGFTQVFLCHFSTTFLSSLLACPAWRRLPFRTQKCLFVERSPCPLGPICLGTGTLQCWDPEDLPQCPGPGG